MVEDLEAMLKKHGTSMLAILAKQQNVGKEIKSINEQLDHTKLKEERKNLYIRKKELTTQDYIFKEFMYLANGGKVVLKENKIPMFEWNRCKYADIRGGWEFVGDYLGGDFYSLWVESSENPSLVYYIKKNGVFCHIATTAKRTPFGFVNDPTSTKKSAKTEQCGTYDLEYEEYIPWRLLVKNVKVASEILFPILSSDFCTSRGVVLFGENYTYAREIFKQVKNGVDLFPTPEHPKGYISRRNRSLEIRTRSWEFIQSLSPSETLEGEIFGSGNSYNAFIFGNNVIVESTEHRHATYFISKQYFDDLRNRSRTELLKENPAGFLGRALHSSDDWESWKEKVQQHIHII